MKNTDGFGVPVMTDQRFGYVKVEEYDALAREVESMRGTILALSVARAERDQYKARLAEAERQRDGLIGIIRGVHGTLLDDRIATVVRTPDSATHRENERE